MTTNTVVLVAVVVAVALVALGLSFALTRRLRAERRELAGGSILEQAALDIQEEATTQAARTDTDPTHPGITPPTTGPMR